jgi:uncharacterized protein (TIGR02246 family)
MTRKQFLFFPVALIAMGCLLPFAAQTTGTSRAADHEALRALKANVVKAFNDRDVSALSQYLADKFVITTIDQTVITSEKQLQDYFEKTFDRPDSIVTDLKIRANADVLTQFLGEDVGYCYGTTDETYTMRGGRIVRMSNRWTALVVKQDGRWKIAALQAGANFLHNPLLNRVRSMGWILAIVGLCIGLLLGLAGAWGLGRLRRAKAGGIPG